MVSRRTYGLSSVKRPFQGHGMRETLQTQIVAGRPALYSDGSTY
jgi:hypothetical protein